MSRGLGDVYKRQISVSFTLQNDRQIRRPTMTKSIQDSLSKVKAHLEAECFNKLYIGGKFVEPINGKSYPTYYPATGELLHEFPRGDANDIASAISAAEAAWAKGEWAEMKAASRAKIVERIAKGIKDNLDMLAEIEAADVGKPFRQAKMAISGAAGEGKYWCSLGAVLDANQDTPVNSGGGEGGMPPAGWDVVCLLYTSPSPRDMSASRMPSSA